MIVRVPTKPDEPIPNWLYLILTEEGYRYQCPWKRDDEIQWEVFAQSWDELTAFAGSGYPKPKSTYVLMWLRERCDDHIMRMWSQWTPRRLPRRLKT